MLIICYTNNKMKAHTYRPTGILPRVEQLCYTSHTYGYVNEYKRFTVLCQLYVCMYVVKIELYHMQYTNNHMQGRASTT